MKKLWKKKQSSLSGESLTKEGIYIAFPSTYSELNKKMDMCYADGLDWKLVANYF